MSFGVDDYELFKQIANWSENQQYIKDIRDAQTWTEEEIRAIVKNDAQINAFFENVKICNIPAKQRNKGDVIGAFANASENVAKFRDVLFYRVKNVWKCDRKSRRKVLYDALGSTEGMGMFLDFVELDDRSRAKTFRTMTINYIPVGDAYFDIKAGVMVDEAPEDELRTYSLPAVDYKPMRLDEARNKLVLDLIKHIGFENVKYMMLTVAQSMRGMFTADRRAVIVTGGTRTGKGTFGKVLKIVGLAPDKELTHDFQLNSDFSDSYAEVSSLYPVVYIDECESVNLPKVKKICSDDTMQVNIKGEPAMTVLNRGVPILTSNTTPTSSIAGIYEKLAFIRTTGIQFNKDNEYFDKLTKEDYDEFICILLTMCHKLTIPADKMPSGKQWDNSMMPPEMEAIHKEFIEENLPTDSFFMQWDKGADSWTSGDDAYSAYLFYSNPDVAYQPIADAVAISKIKPTKTPDGLNGVSRRSFTSLAKSHLETRTKDGYKQFRGIPPKHSYEGEGTLGVDFQ